MNAEVRLARHLAMEGEAPICVLSVPILSGLSQGDGIVPPPVEVYASMRPHSVADVPCAARRTPAMDSAQADVGLTTTISGAYHATRIAAHNARLAAAGRVTRDRAEKAAAVAEGARTEAAELAITFAHAQLAVLDARIASLRRQRDRVEMRASVASLLMARDAQVGATRALDAPMFTLVHAGLTTIRVDVFEQDLLRLVAGQDVTLVPDDPTDPLTGNLNPGGSFIDLRARLAQARAAYDPSCVVRGMFLTAGIVPHEGGIFDVPGPSSACYRHRHT